MDEKCANLLCIDFPFCRLVFNRHSHPATTTENARPTKCSTKLFDQNCQRPDRPLPESKVDLEPIQTRMSTSGSQSGTNLSSGNPDRVAQDPGRDGSGCQRMARQRGRSSEKVFQSKFAFRQKQMVLHIHHSKSVEKFEAETEKKRLQKQKLKRTNSIVILRS